jgi:hypothetical protein
MSSFRTPRRTLNAGNETKEKGKKEKERRWEFFLSIRGWPARWWPAEISSSSTST